jgi:CubicO group peptidase (beta-lactamase class C family)
LPYHTFSRTGDGDVGYGYAWWVMDGDFGSGTYHAWGWGDQHIFVMPEYDMVVVHTGGSYYEGTPIFAHQVVLDYVIPSIH